MSQSTHYRSAANSRNGDASLLGEGGTRGAHDDPIGKRHHRVFSAFLNKVIRTLRRCPPNAEGKMRVIIPTLVGLVALAAASVQAAPVPSNPHPHSKWHETPTQNVRKSQQYDHLVSTNSSFRASRMRKECGPIGDAELRADCLGSFSTYQSR